MNKYVYNSSSTKDEIVVFTRHDGVTSARLTFDNPKNVKLYDRSGKQYTNGIDYKVINDEIFALNDEIFAFDSEWLSYKNVPPYVENENERYKIEGCLLIGPEYLYKKQYLVSYSHSEAKFPQIVSDRLQLDKTYQLIKNKKQIKIALLGDSISNAANSSYSFGYGGSHWLNSATKKLSRRYGAKFKVKNFSRSGYATDWGVEGIEQASDYKADVVIIAFGMNDGTANVSLDTFADNLKTIIAKARSYNQNTEFILISTPVPNPQYKYGNARHHAYRLIMKELEQDGVTMLDMTLAFDFLVERKNYVEISGNNFNHPNDFSYRFYTSAIEELFDKLVARKQNDITFEKYFEVPKFEEVKFSQLEPNIRAGYLINEVYGDAKKTFVFYGIPNDVKQKVPCVVLAHGAGGCASPEWVKGFTDNGIAAISIDLESFHFDLDDLTQKKPNPDLPPRDLGGFRHVLMNPYDSGIYYTVAQILSAHSFMRSLSFVDIDKTALVGISWGGVDSLIALSVDKRFSASAIIYSSAFISEDLLGYEAKLHQNGKRKEFYDIYYDPRNYVTGIKTPTLFTAGLDDAAFSPFNRRRTYRLFDGEVELALKASLYHDNESNYRNKNVLAYLSDKFFNTSKRSKLNVTVSGEDISINVIGDCERIELLHTHAKENPHKIEWTAKDVPLINNSAVIKIPDCKYFMVVCHFDDGQFVSSDIFEKERYIN